MSCCNLLKKSLCLMNYMPSLTLTEVVTNDNVVEPYAGEN